VPETDPTGSGAGEGAGNFAGLIKVYRNFMGLCHNSKNRLISARHAGLDPASRFVTACKENGFRVMPGMTK
jgi:hypothetical protein